MSDYFLGEIRMFPMGYAPADWHLCDGTAMDVSKNQALFSLLGMTYGGNGSTTFNLPDLRGRAIVGANPMQADYTLGHAGGAETVAITTAQMPPHNHQVMVHKEVGTALNPSGNYLSACGTNTTVPTAQNLFAAPSASAVVPLNPKSLSSAGDGKAHANMQPFLAMNYCIAISGIYPPRN